METEILAIIIGWLLGILSTPLAMYFVGVVERRRFKDVLNEELREVRFRLALAVYQLRVHLKKIDRPFLGWMIVEMNAYSNDPVRNSTLEGVRATQNLTDAELTAFNLRPCDPLGTKSFPRIVLPYLSSKMDSVGLLCSSKQKELVNLMHYVEVINVKSAELAEWNMLSFQIGDHENHARVSRNADISIQAIAASAEKAIACIRNYLF